MSERVGGECNFEADVRHRSNVGRPHAASPKGLLRRAAPLDSLHPRPVGNLGKPDFSCTTKRANG
jgi:hypothetical protein